MNAPSQHKMAFATPAPDIKITDVIAHPLTQKLPKSTVTSWGTYEHVSLVLVEIRTDAGINGVGETLARFAPKAYAELINNTLRPRLIGKPVHEISAHWNNMRRALSGRCGGMLIEAIAGVDIALWDILGKAANMPLWMLLGGQGRKSIPVYAASINWVEDAEADAELDAYLEAGFPRIKIKTGKQVKESCRRIERLRKRAGDAAELCIDSNWAYNLDSAIEVANALEDNGYFWFEEPLNPEDEAGYEELRKRTSVPLAAGESNYTVDQAQRLVQNRTLSVLQPDIARSGGVTETRRMAEMAHACGVGYAPHIGMSGIVCETASIHVASAMPNLRMMECHSDISPFKTELADIASASQRQKDGELSVPTGPGLGLDINWDVVERLRTS
ncbi:MAG: mandelate racemase/muconate lactonizing enzyme family protein [Alphaproteobacteria bacterium]|nr:mandelate racemase/muconate lactonizing enzyme family protein [Alphaproteobacteria bacterium]